MKLYLQCTSNISDKRKKGEESRKTHLDSKCGMAESCGPYRAALSYNSKSGMARSFMFLGTARTSVCQPELIRRVAVVEVEETRRTTHSFQAFELQRASCTLLAS